MAPPFMDFGKVLQSWEWVDSSSCVLVVTVALTAQDQCRVEGESAFCALLLKQASGLLLYLLVAKVFWCAMQTLTEKEEFCDPMERNCQVCIKIHVLSDCQSSRASASEAVSQPVVFLLIVGSAQEAVWAHPSMGHLAEMLVGHVGKCEGCVMVL